MTKAAIIKRLMEDEEKRVTVALQIKDYMLVESLGKRLYLLKILSSGEWCIDELSDFHESLKRNCCNLLDNIKWLYENKADIPLKVDRPLHVIYNHFRAQEFITRKVIRIHNSPLRLRRELLEVVKLGHLDTVWENKEESYL